MATDVNQAKLSLEKFFKTRHFSFSSEYRELLNTVYDDYLKKALPLHDLYTANESFLLVCCVFADAYSPEDAPMAHRAYAEYRLYCLGQRIRIRRRDLKISQTELGRRLNRSLRSIQKYENGEIDCGICLLEEIAIQLSTTPYTLMGYGSAESFEARYILSYPHAITCLFAALEAQNNG